MTYPIALFRCPQRIRPLDAESMAEICRIEFRALTGRANVLEHHKGEPIPVVCINADVEYWQLECNDPDIRREELEALAENIRNWKDSRLLTQD